MKDVCELAGRPSSSLHKQGTGVEQGRASEASPMTFRVLQFYMLALPFYAISFYNIGERGVLRPDWIAGSFLIFSFLTVVGGKRLRELNVEPLVLLIVLAATLSALNLFDAPGRRLVDFAASYAQMMLAIATYIVISNLRVRWDQLFSLLRLWVLLAGLHSAYAIYQAFARVLDLPLAWPRILNPSYSGDMARTREILPGFYISSGVFPEPSFLAQYLVPPLIVFVLLLVYDKGAILFQKKSIRNGTVALILIALFLSTRLTAYAPPLIVLGLFLLDGHSRVLVKQRFCVAVRLFRYLLLGLVLLAAVSLVFRLALDLEGSLLGVASRRTAQLFISLSHPTEARLSVLARHQESLSLDTRMSRAYEGLKVWWQHPIIGVGMKGLQHHTNSTDRVHSAFLQILIEQGIVGFIPYVGLWLVTAIRLRRRFLHHRHRAEAVILLSTFYMIISTSILAFLGKSWFALLWWFNLALGALVTNRFDQLVRSEGT